jgi:hypothetical protein
MQQEQIQLALGGQQGQQPEVPKETPKLGVGGR